MSYKDPYGTQPEEKKSNQSVGVSDMLWGEEDPAYEEEKKKAGCCACSTPGYAFILIGGTVLALLAKFISQHLWLTYGSFCPKASDSQIIRDLCVQNQTVYRISAVLAFFFLFMTVMTICSTTFHYSSWILKFSLLSTLFTVSFFIPGQFFAMYREASRWGSLLFIVTQVLVLVDFAHTVHENLVKHVGDDGDESSPNATKARALYLGLSIFSIISFIIGVIFLYIKYNPCSLHATMISLTLIFGVIVTALSLLDVISKGLLPPTLLSAYCVLIVYQALSTNTTDSCTASDVSKDMPTWLVIVSFILSICQVAWMGIRAGSNNRAFVDTSVSQYTRSPLSEQSQANINNTRDPYNNNDDNSNDLPGGRYQALETEKGAEKQQQESSGATRHWIFHLTLVLCSMYIAMMLTGWGSEEATSFNNPEASEQSFWIKMISVFASFGLYFWTLIAPIIFPNRDFS